MAEVANGATGAPRVSLVAQAATSAIYGVGIDFDRAVARTVPAGQVISQSPVAGTSVLPGAISEDRRHRRRSSLMAPARAR